MSSGYVSARKLVPLLFLISAVHVLRIAIFILTHSDLFLYIALLCFVVTGPAWQLDTFQHISSAQ